MNKVNKQSNKSMNKITPEHIYCGDNYDLLLNMKNECVDLIYLDPPFNSNKKYIAPTNSIAKGAQFKDIFEKDDVKPGQLLSIQNTHSDIYNFIKNVYEREEIQHNKSRNSKECKHHDYYYLIFMSIRLIQLHRVLKSTGSIYLHIDPTMSHYLKIIMDMIFGRENFRNEVVWHYKGGALTAAKNQFPKKHDVILFYSKSENSRFQNPRLNAVSEEMKERWGKYFEDDGCTVLYGSIKHEKSEERRSRRRIIKKLGRNPRDTDVAFVCKPSLIYTVWEIPEVRNNPRYQESTGYPTQKPLALLERIIKASSNEGDIVLDPFCGCATACVSAKRLDRGYIGIDISQASFDILQRRFKQEGLYQPNFKYKLKNQVSTTPKQDFFDNIIDDKNTKLHHVYIVSNKAYPNQYKIGYQTTTGNTINKIEGRYNIGSPERDYKVEAYRTTHFYKELEKYMHKKYNASHEWIYGDLDDIIKTLNEWKED